MKISFSPMRCDDMLVLEKTGDILTINGLAFDFTDVPNWATLPLDAVDCDFLVSDVERISGQIHLTLRLPHGANVAQSVLFAETVTIVADGAIALPTDTQSHISQEAEQ